MEARDFRGLGRPAQEARRRALFLVEREGMTQGQAARAVGAQRQTVDVRLKRHREGACWTAGGSRPGAARAG